MTAKSSSLKTMMTICFDWRRLLHSETPTSVDFCPEMV